METAGRATVLHCRTDPAGRKTEGSLYADNGRDDGLGLGPAGHTDKVSRMRHLNITLDIAAPVDRVWLVMSDVERWHEWTRSITKVTRHDSGPLTVGSQAIVRQPKLPPARWTVTEVVPGRHFTWENVAPGLRVIGRHEVEATAVGSRATLSIQMRGLLASPWWRLTKGITERYVRFEAEGLKARSENPEYRHASL